MASPPTRLCPSISQGEALSRDNRKQVLRAGRWWRADGEDGRTAGLQLCRTEETEGFCPKERCCTETDCLKWKFLRRADQEIRRPSRLTKCETRNVGSLRGEKKDDRNSQKCGSGSINTHLNHNRDAKFTLTEAHLQVEMVSCPTQTLLYPNPPNYTQYSTCVSTHVQHYS